MAPSGAYPVDDEHERRREALLVRWAAVSTLALAVCVAAALLFLAQDGEEERTGQRRATVRVASVGGEAGRLSAGGEELLPLRGRTLGPYVGQTARGEGLRVLAVTQGEGLLVGTGSADSIYVEWGANVGEDEPGEAPRTGDRVDLTGPLKAAPLEPERSLDLSPEEAEIVRERGAYINADRVARRS